MSTQASQDDLFRSRYDELYEETEEFIQAHPKVWPMFCRFTLELIARGFKAYGVVAIFERIRWETDQADKHGASTFKINNNYRSFFARRFMRKYPQHEGFFRTRHQTSQDEPPCNLPPLGPKDFG